MNVVKEKNILMISQEAGKVYKIDLSNLVVYGLAGKPIKNLPKPLQNSHVQHQLHKTETLEHALAFAVVQIFNNHVNDEARALQALSLFERFLAVNLKPGSWIDIYRNFNFFANVKLDGKLIAYAIEKHNGEINQDVLNAYEMRTFREKYPLNDEQYNQIMQIYRQTDSMEFAEFMAINVLHRFVSEMDGWRSIACKFFDMAKDLEKDWRKEKFLFDAYCRYRVEHRAWQDKEIDKKIMKHYNEKLMFENDTFTVIIPKTAQEIRQEGANNRNCVSGYVNYVARGETIVVFVRYKNNPTKSFVTCSIDPHSFDIEQFYEARNSTPCEIARQFQREYQNYLKSLR